MLNISRDFLLLSFGFQCQGVPSPSLARAERLWYGAMGCLKFQKAPVCFKIFIRFCILTPPKTLFFSQCPSKSHFLVPPVVQDKASKDPNSFFKFIIRVDVEHFIGEGKLLHFIIYYNNGTPEFCPFIKMAISQGKCPYPPKDWN